MGERRQNYFGLCAYTPCKIRFNPFRRTGLGQQEQYVRAEIITNTIVGVPYHMFLVRRAPKPYSNY